MTPTTQAPNAPDPAGTPYTNGSHKRPHLDVRVWATGQVTIDGGALGRVVLTHAQGNRLIMAARMHAVDRFAGKIAGLLDSTAMVEAIAAGFARREGSARWNLKEAFARLMTVSKEAAAEASAGAELDADIPLGAAAEVIDEVTIEL
jgi:hypothetical protein